MSEGGEFYALVEKKGFYLLELGKSEYDQASFEAYLEALRSFYEAHDNVNLVVDLSNLAMPPSPWFFSRQLEFSVANKLLSKKAIKQTIIIVESPFLRSLLETLFLLSPPACPVEIRSDLCEFQCSA